MKSIGLTIALMGILWCGVAASAEKDTKIYCDGIRCVHDYLVPAQTDMNFVAVCGNKFDANTVCEPAASQTEMTCDGVEKSSKCSCHNRTNGPAVATVHVLCRP